MAAAPPTVERLVDAMLAIAPLRYAEAWDNVGLLLGSRRWPMQRVLLTIDLTEAVLAEAIRARVHAIVSYHPPLFHATKAVTDATPLGRVLVEAAANRIAVYSPHTALDAAPGGLNDWLAAGVGEGDVRALEPFAHLPETEECKIVTFAPAGAIDKIRDGLASAGAGRIGEYERCSFEIRGSGTFFGGAGSNPAVGRRGTLERVDEVRLEMVCPRDALALAIATLREFHPYEEPPIEIHPLAARPQRDAGPGRRVVLDQPATLSVLVKRIKDRLGVRHLSVAEPRPAAAKFKKIAVCAGAGGSMLQRAIQTGCELFLTGEMRHHDVLGALASGCAVILAGHTNTERGYLPTLQRRLSDRLPQIRIAVAKRDADPLATM